jgi:hypothetical protein
MQVEDSAGFPMSGASEIPSPGGTEGRQAHGERISLGGGDDSVVRIQLAARWAEAFASGDGDSLTARLQRFRLAYEYLDAVTHGVEPPGLNGESG